MATVNQKLEHARASVLPALLAGARDLHPMASMVLPTVEPMLHQQLDALLARPPAELDAWLAQGIDLLRSLQSDPEPDDDQEADR